VDSKLKKNILIQLITKGLCYDGIKKSTFLMGGFLIATIAQNFRYLDYCSLIHLKYEQLSPRCSG
jgi:hypothetical protein